MTPILFCLVCAYMLHSSLMYTGKGALIGVAVLLLGLPVLWDREAWPRHFGNQSPKPMKKLLLLIASLACSTPALTQTAAAPIVPTAPGSFPSASQTSTMSRHPWKSSQRCSA
jgi:hypothetical protein